MPSPRDARAGRASVELGIKDRLQKGLDGAAQKLKTFGAGIAKVGGLTTAAGAGVAAPLIAAATGFAKAGDELDKMSGRTKVSVEELSALGFAAQQSGSSIEDVQAALFRMNRRVANAATEMGPARRAIELLGLDAGKLSQLPADEQMRILADELNNLGDEALASQLGFELFGDQFRNLRPLLNGGSEGINKLTQEARDLGITLTEEDATAAAEFTDAMGVAVAQLKAIKNQIGAAVAPVLSDLLARITPIVTKAIEWVRENRALVATVLKVAAGVAAAGAAISAIGGIISGAGIALAGMSAAAAALPAVLGALGALGLKLLIFGAVGVAIFKAGQAFLEFTELGQQAVGFLKAKLADLLAFTRQLFGGLVDAFKAGNLQLAAEQLWLALQITWKSGISKLLSAWDNLKAGALFVFDSLVLQIRKLWVATVGFIAKEVQGFVLLIAQQFRAVFDLIGKLLPGLAADLELFVNVDPEQVKRNIEESTAAKIEDLEKAAEQKNAKRFSDADARLSRREAELAELNRQLDQTIEQAARERTEAEQKKAEAAAAAASEVPPDIIAKASAVLSAVGSFSARQAQQFVSSTTPTEERIASAAEATAENTAAIAGELASGAGTFA